MVCSLTGSFLTEDGECGRRSRRGGSCDKDGLAHCLCDSHASLDMFWKLFPKEVLPAISPHSIIFGGVRGLVGGDCCEGWGSSGRRSLDAFHCCHGPNPGSSSQSHVLLLLAVTVAGEVRGAGEEKGSSGAEWYVGDWM